MTIVITSDEFFSTILIKYKKDHKKDHALYVKRKLMFTMFVKVVSKKESGQDKCGQPAEEN